jgi:HSP20 family protein
MSEDTSVQTVPVNVYRTSDLVTVAAPTPGLGTPQGRLVIRGHLRGALKDVKEIVVDEWSARPYHREVELPGPVDGEGATVTYGNGVLVVAMRVAERVRPARLTLEEIGPARGERVPEERRPGR